MDRRLTLLNREVEQLKSRVNENEAEIKSLNCRILYQDVYSRREMLRFFNIPEQETLRNLFIVLLKGSLKWIMLATLSFNAFIKSEKRSQILLDQSFPVSFAFPIERRSLDVLELKDEIDVKLYAYYPREIQERRKKLWPHVKRAREQGKRGFFNKKEPDKLIIDGHVVT